MDTVRVTLVSSHPQYQIEPSIVIVPASSTPTELSDLVNHVLGGDSEGRQFAFHIQDTLIRGTLSSSISSLGISREELCTISYEIPEHVPEVDWEVPEPDWIRAVATTPAPLAHPSRVLTGSYDGLVRLYTRNSQNHFPPAIFKNSQNSLDCITALCWIDQDRFASGSSAGTVKIWHTSSTNAPEQHLKGHSASIQSITLHQGSLISADFDGYFCIFSTSTDAAQAETKLPLAKPPPKKPLVKRGAPKCKTADMPEPLGLVQSAKVGWKGHDGPISAVLSCKEGILSFGWDRHAKMWQIPNAILLDSWISDVCVSAAAIAEANGQIAAGHSDGSIRIFDQKDRSRSSVARRFFGHDGWVTAVAFDPENPSRLITAGHDGAVKVWDTRSPSHPISFLQTSSPPGPRQGKILSADWQSSGIAFGGEDRILKFCSQ